MSVGRNILLSTQCFSMLVVVAVVILVVVSGTASYGPNGHVPP